MNKAERAILHRAMAVEVKKCFVAVKEGDRDAWKAANAAYTALFRSLSKAEGRKLIGSIATFAADNAATKTGVPYLTYAMTSFRWGKEAT